jgi:serine/threonine-protein kinase
MSIIPVPIKFDGVTFGLKEDHPFDWLRDLGYVFRVFDKQDSGNLSFGIEKKGQRYFVKYAGASTYTKNTIIRTPLFFAINSCLLSSD